MKKWFLYVLKAKDGSLYTGTTTDLNRRLEEHNRGTGAKSLRGKLPVELMYNEIYNSCSEARKREIEIKGLKREDKLKLINSRPASSTPI